MIRVYRDSDASMDQVAKDFGISPSCLKRWLAIDEKNSTRPYGSTQSGSESEALREANKRIKLLEQENEVLQVASARRRGYRGGVVLARDSELTRQTVPSRRVRASRRSRTRRVCSVARAVAQHCGWAVLSTKTRQDSAQGHPARVVRHPEVVSFPLGAQWVGISPDNYPVT